MGHVESVNIAVPRTGAWTGSVGKTGIDKRPVAGPVLVERAGVRDDSVCDTKHHGSWYQAVYAFDTEDLRYWSHELATELVAGNAGENLTLADCDCAEAVVGERWRVGDAVLRVTGPRIPCRVFAAFWEADGLVKRFTARGRPGAYLAVEAPGEVRAGDSRELLSRPEHGVTVAEVMAFRMRARTDIAEHVATGMADLPEEWRAEVEKVLRVNGRVGIR
ncbi:MOSC domain-containing protein [Parasphingorhabdus pacifica]